MEGYKLQHREELNFEISSNRGVESISLFERTFSSMRAEERDESVLRHFGLRRTAEIHLAKLTARQHQIMELILAGHRNKNIAADLGISQRTVENHRASIMKRTGSKSLPALARLAVAASWT